MARKEVLVFAVGDRSYGLDVDCIHGIENYVAPTPVANAPQNVCGIINIRDEIFPVVDMRLKLKVNLKDVTENTKLVLIKTKLGKLACLVDAVQEIYAYDDSEEKKEFPLILRVDSTRYADYIVKVKEQLVIVVNENNLLSKEEYTQVQNMLDI